MTARAGRIGAVLGHTFAHGKDLSGIGRLLQWGNVWRRWRRRRAKDITQNPLASNNRGCPRSIGRHGKNTALPEQTAADAALVKCDAAEAAAVDVGDAVMLRQTLIHKGVVGPQKVEHIPVLAHDALEKHFGLA